MLRTAVPDAVAQAGVDPEQVVGIGTDFTACTILPTLSDGTPLCLVPQWTDRPHAYPKLWKHHAAQAQADQINALAHERGEPWIGRYGGKISPEWAFAKGLQLLDEDPEVYQRADRFIEAADWIIWQLCGTETRNACTAGYKGIYQDGRYPSRDYLAALRPGFADFVDKLDHPISPLGGRAGGLTGPAAGWTGLPEGIAVAVGNVDAHVTAAAAQALGAGPAGRDHGDVDLPRHERRPAGRGARHVRCRRRRHLGRSLGLRGRAERGRRHLRLVRRTRRAGRLRRATRSSPPPPRSSPSARTAWSPWTGGTATGRCWSTTSSADCWWG